MNLKKKRRFMFIHVEERVKMLLECVAAFVKEMRIFSSRTRKSVTDNFVHSSIVVSDYLLNNYMKTYLPEIC